MGLKSVVTTAGLLLGFCLPATAVGKSDIASWNARIQETVGLLHGARAPEARAAIATVLDEMTRSVNPGKRAAHAFGLALMLRALAEAGVGDERAALWDWHLAQQFDPPLEGWDLREFGAAGELLERHRLAKDPVPTAPRNEDLEKEGGQAATVVERGRPPSYIENVRLRRWEGSLKVAFRIGADGVAGYPRLVQSSDELGMVLDACEFARALVFAPGKRDGEAIAVLYELTVSYRLR